MVALICECCGGTINPETMQCEYCNTKYIDNSLDVMRMELEDDLYFAALETLRKYTLGRAI